jgi:hypothetical protein
MCAAEPVHHLKGMKRVSRDADAGISAPRARSYSEVPCWVVSKLSAMEETPLQILEVRSDGSEATVTVTAAASADASKAIFVALSEQLDRRRAAPTMSVEDVLALREHTTLAERFEPLANADAHAIVSLSDAELRTCLLELASYAERVDGEHFQPAELRERLALIAEITPVLWDANAAVAAAAEALTHAGH